MGVELSEFTEIDLDRSTARAWVKFQARLADHVVEMDDDDFLVVEAESAVDEEDADGCAPYIQFCAWGDDLVRCEVSSNEYLAAEHQLTPAAVETLEGLGWAPPTCVADDADPGDGSANFHLDLERSDADRLAVMAVKALREVFGVEHPVFLSADNLAEADEPALNFGIASSQSAAGPEPDEPIAVPPTDHEHLQALVDEALTPVFGHLPEHDEDDDIPVASGSGLVFVRVSEGAPNVHMFAPLVRGVNDLERARFEVGVLNRERRFIKFVLVDDRVTAHLDLPAMPFVPSHLRVMLAVMSETVDEVGQDLVARVGGRLAFDAAVDEEPAEDENDKPRLHPASHSAMMALLELEAESPGSVDPEVAASVCGMDRDRILELITWNRGIESPLAEWASKLLRQALRVVVDRELGR